MKIASWNVNGLRSSVSLGLQSWLEEAQNDVVCLQEAKAQPDLLSELWFKNYRAYWNSAERKGYSGVITLVRSDLNVVSIETGIGDRELDAEGRVLCTGLDDFEVINVYAPHSHRELTRLDAKLAFCRHFDEYLAAKRKNSKPLIIAGDLNVAHTEKDLTNWAANRKNAGFLPQEREWIDRLLASGFVDAFREFCPDTGHYTWWSPIKGVRERNVGWRIDYILVDERLRSNLEKCYHSPEVQSSDHCPVTAEIDVLGLSHSILSRTAHRSANERR
jgi:exodeoxyribonuclease III